MKISLFCTLLFNLLLVSTSFSQENHYHDRLKLDSAVNSIRSQTRTYIENGHYDSIVQILNLPPIVCTTPPDTNGVTYSYGIQDKFTKREEIILQFLVKDYRTILSDILYGKDYFSLKGGEVENISCYDISRFDSSNLTLDIIPILKNIKIDSLIQAKGLNHIEEDIELLKIYWKRILIQIESKYEFSEEFNQLAIDYKSKYPDYSNATPFLNNNFNTSQKIYMHSSFNLKASYAPYSYANKQSAKFNQGGDFSISYKKLMFDIGFGYTFIHAETNDSIFNDDVFLISAGNTLTANSYYIYYGFHLLKYKRVEFEGILKYGGATVYNEKQFLYRSPYMSLGIDFRLNLSKHYKVQVSKLTYKKEEYQHKYNPVYLVISCNNTNDVFNPNSVQNHVLNLSVGLNWKIGRLTPNYNIGSVEDFWFRMITNKY